MSVVALGSCDVSFHTLAARPAAMAAPRTVISVKSGRTESKGKNDVHGLIIAHGFPSLDREGFILKKKFLEGEVGVELSCTVSPQLINVCFGCH